MPAVPVKYVLMGHWLHVPTLTAPAAVEYMPEQHDRHVSTETAVTDAEYFPARHSVHTWESIGEYPPATHVSATTVTRLVLVMVGVYSWFRLLTWVSRIALEIESNELITLYVACWSAVAW